MSIILAFLMSKHIFVFEEFVNPSVLVFCDQICEKILFFKSVKLLSRLSRKRKDSESLLKELYLHTEIEHVFTFSFRETSFKLIALNYFRHGKPS